jgi:NADH-quinone oxidoreductase subunit N
MYNMILPDFLLLGLGLLILFVDLFSSSKNSLAFHLSWIGLSVIFLFLNTLPGDITYNYFGTYSVTGFGILFREIFVFSALMTLLLSRVYFTQGADAQAPLKYNGEFNSIIILCTFGMVTVVSAGDLLTLFIGLELATIPLYFLSSWNKSNPISSEAATKFVIMGSVSTAFMLFGFSYLYGAAGSLDLKVIGQFISSMPDSSLVWLGVLLVFTGIGFKLTLFPFHMWAPDVYHGAPAPVTAFLSVSSKATAIAFLLVMVYGPFAAIHSKLEYLILLLAGATMVAGNLGAMKQRHLRRFMGWSSVAQAGYILTAMAGPAETAISSVIYYLFIYAFTNYAVFFIFSITGRQSGETFESLRGLVRKSPGLAAILAICMFSLAGIPPVAGFMGKFMLFASAAKSGYFFFVIFAALNSTLSLYYYLLIIKEAYVIKPEDHEASTATLKITLVQKISLGLLTAGVILLGLIPTLSSNILEIIRLN